MWVELGCEKTEAALRISFARRSSRTSPRRRPSSSRSSLPNNSSRLPRSASAWRTHLRSVSAGMPKSRATWAIGRPKSKTNRAPRSNNSSGYFLGRDMTQEILHSPGQDPGYGVSVETGLAHRFSQGALFISCGQPCHGYLRLETLYLSSLPPAVWGERRRTQPKPDTEMMCSSSLVLPPSCCCFQRRRYPGIVGRVDGHTWGGDLVDPIENLIGELDLSGEYRVGRLLATTRLAVAFTGHPLCLDQLRGHAVSYRFPLLFLSLSVTFSD